MRRCSSSICEARNQVGTRQDQSSAGSSCCSTESQDAVQWRNSSLSVTHHVECTINRVSWYILYESHMTLFNLSDKGISLTLSCLAFGPFKYYISHLTHIMVNQKLLYRMEGWHVCRYIQYIEYLRVSTRREESVTAVTPEAGWMPLLAQRGPPFSCRES